MTKFTLTCCSTADMPRAFFEERNIPFACFHFTMDGVEYTDDLGLSMPFDEFYERVANGAVSTTSQVNTSQYISLFTPILEGGSDIVHLALSSGISGTYSSCMTAVCELREKYPDRKIICIDTLCASSGYGLLVDYAADLRDSGLGAEETAELIEKRKLTVHHWFFTTDLTYFYRGGRISKTSAVMGNLLHVCPLLNVDHEGKLALRDKYRGKKRVIEALVNRMETFAENGLEYSGKCIIAQSACYEDAKKAADLIEERFKSLNGVVQINTFGTVIGSHTGPGTVALFFFGEERSE